MTALLTHRSEARMLAVCMVMAFMAVACVQPAEAIKMKTIGAIAGGVGGALVGLGLWQLAALFMVAGALGGGIIMGLIIPAAIFIVPTIIGALLGGGLGAWIDKQFGGSSKRIRVDPSSDF